MISLLRNDAEKLKIHSGYSFILNANGNNESISSGISISLNLWLLRTDKVSLH